MIIVFAIVSAVLAETAFLIGYLLSFAIFMLVHLGFTYVVRRSLPHLLHASLSGVAGGCGATFCALAVALLIARKVGIPDSLALLLGLGLPVIGEFQDFEFNVRLALTRELRPVGFFGSLHSAMKSFPRRFAYDAAMYHLGESQPRTEDDEASRRTAANYAHWFLWRMSGASLLGAAIGMIAIMRWLHPDLVSAR